MDASKLFLSRSRSNGVKLRCKQAQLDSTKFFFTNGVVREWSKLPPSGVQCDTINSFKNKLNHHLPTKTSERSELSDVLPAV